MIIKDSSVSMNSSRLYEQFSGIKKGKLVPQEDFLDTYERYSGSNNIAISNYEKPKTYSSYREMQMSLLRRLMERLMSANRFGQNFFGQNLLGQGMRIESVYSENESTSFSATGRAMTEDGRQIDFGIDIEMSRSFMEYTNVQISPTQAVLTDPLVVNVSSDVVSVSNQKFKFDLDADGAEEEMSMLGSGSGFLAIDKNGDGVINDGSELFGTKSGNGFYDLAQYDKDHNGWIDEADEVYSKLRVWCKSPSGEDILMNLKEADIGAIFLGSQSTQFSLKGLGGVDAVIRSSGVYLKESGGVGTVQHVDMATA